MNEDLILLTRVGSDLHGTSVDDQDDTDLMGVYIERPEIVLGMHDYKKQHKVWTEHADGTRKAEGQRSGPGDTDYTLYGLRKYVDLAAAGNPTVIMPLYASGDAVLFCSFNRGLLKERIVTRQAGKKFLGYCNGQRAQMVNEKGKHTNRPELIEQFGFDTKFAYHAIRLAVQGQELLDTGKVTLPMSEFWSHTIKDIRRGEWSLAEVLELLDFQINRLKVSVNSFEGPDRADRKDLDRLVKSSYLQFWGMKNEAFS